MRTRTFLLLATAFTGATIAGLGVAVGGTAAPEQARPPADRASAVAVRASEILGAWDRARGRAWSRGDAAALADLYTRRSPTGAHDVDELRRWRGRGLRVTGLRQQVIELRVLAETSRALVLRVTDRTVDGVAVGHGRRTALPTGGWSTHRIRLRRADGRWRVDEVVPQPAR